MILLTTACALMEVAVISTGLNVLNHGQVFTGAIQGVAIYFIVKLGKIGLKYVQGYSLRMYDLSLIFKYVVQLTLAAMVLGSALNLSSYLLKTSEESNELVAAIALTAAIIIVICAPGGYLWTLTHRNKVVWDKKIFKSDATLAALTCSEFALVNMAEVSAGTHFRGVVIFSGVEFPMEFTVTILGDDKGAFSYKVHGLEAYLTEPYQLGFNRLIHDYYMQYVRNKSYTGSY